MGFLPIRQSKHRTNGPLRSALGASLSSTDRNLCIGRKIMLRWFNNLKIAHKLTLGFGLILLLMIATQVIGVLASRQQTDGVHQLVHRLYLSRRAANEIVTLVYIAQDARLLY